jgi:hypothetical protein
VKSFTDKLLEMAVTVLVVAILLNVAWQMLKQVLPLLVAAAVIAIGVRYQRR